VLALAPTDHFLQEWGGLGDTVEVATQLKPVGKYYAVHRPVYDHIVQAVEGMGSYLRRDTLANAIKAASSVPLEDVATVFQSLSQGLAVNPAQFWLAEDDDPLNFSGGMAELESKPFSISKLSFGMDEEQPVIKEEAVPTKQIQPNLVPSSQGFDGSSLGPAKVIPLNERFAKAGEADSLNDSYTNDQNPTSLNERFGNPQKVVNTVSDMYRPNTKVESIKMVIPLNKKFSFINELFNGNSQEFNEAIDLIDSMHDYPSAIQLVKERYFRKNNWDIEKDEVKEFYELLSRKF
jgi:hypothetical protein